jgi:hypothetical protein
VAVVGKLWLSEWTTKDGERRSEVQVVADAVQFVGKPKQVGDPDGGVADSADKPAERPTARNLKAQGRLNPHRGRPPRRVAAPHGGPALTPAGCRWGRSWHVIGCRAGSWCRLEKGVAYIVREGRVAAFLHGDDGMYPEPVRKGRPTSTPWQLYLWAVVVVA